MMKTASLHKRLEQGPVKALAPCRVDMGGTLDIRTFYLPLRQAHPCTFNIALDMKTRVSLYPHTPGRIRISSIGFADAEFPADAAPFDHPMGLMFAVATYFQADGVHIRIESSSPPRSALGGSSAAAVALVAAFDAVLTAESGSGISRPRIAMLAHAVEESVAGVPCGFQDQLAAVYGGVHAWHWPAAIEDPPFRREPVFQYGGTDRLMDHILVAYCGIPHVSADINGRWVRQFLAGRYRREWGEIITCTKKFIDSLSEHNYKGAAEWMEQETSIRRAMTPDVLDSMGEKLVDAAAKADCGARFTGAGGGGCIWAVGEREAIQTLAQVWQELTASCDDARLLPTAINTTGVTVNRFK